jgi:hypothetical protein
MLDGAKPYTLMDKLSRWIFSLIIIPAAYYFLSNQGHYTWIDNFDLIIHEPGHFFFAYFGDTLHILGGTLMQLIVPTLLIIYAIRAHKLFMTQFVMCFLAQNLINISVYAGDAVTMKLHLFGPPGAKHDWHYLLLKFDMLNMTDSISMFFFIMAGITFLIAILAPLYIKK